jgi:hypothetical protein
VISAGAANARQLSDTIRLRDRGLSISYELSKNSTTGLGILKGYAYGHLKLSDGLTLFEPVTGRSLQSNADLGVTPEKLFVDPFLGSLTPIWH